MRQLDRFAIENRISRSLQREEASFTVMLVASTVRSPRSKSVCRSLRRRIPLDVIAKT